MKQMVALVAILLTVAGCHAKRNEARLALRTAVAELKVATTPAQIESARNHIDLCITLHRRELSEFIASLDALDRVVQAEVYFSGGTARSIIMDALSEDHLRRVDTNADLMLLAFSSRTARQTNAYFHHWHQSRVAYRLRLEACTRLRARLEQ